VSDCLYAALGVPRDAEPETIRRAYRRLSKLHRPDHNPGDAAAAERYIEIERAYRVLIDPERRARYDATGEADEPKGDPTVGELAGTLCHALATVVRLATGQGVGVARINIVEHMRRFLTEGANAAEKRRASMQAVADNLAAAAERFTNHEGEENLLALVARNHLAAVRKEMAAIEAERARINRAIEHLKACGYRTDVADRAEGFGDPGDNPWRTFAVRSSVMEWKPVASIKPGE
jgi:hypothetical protein